MVHFLWSKLWDLPWWGTGLVILIIVYYIGRALYIYFNVKDQGFIEGFKRFSFDSNEEYIRLHHVLRTILDIPALFIGMFFPIIKAIFTLKIKKIKKPDKPVSSRDVYGTFPRD